MRDWHDQLTLARLIAEAGWDEVEWLNLTFGVVALHRGVKPTATPDGAPTASE
jgi:demethylmenaquinone methyltransferase/2-methoxy-6-polyprenyl-1,4-benzoquinol methylase